LVMPSGCAEVPSMSFSPFSRASTFNRRPDDVMTDVSVLMVAAPV
jgi:hypothetical protein